MAGGNGFLPGSEVRFPYLLATYRPHPSPLRGRSITVGCHRSGRDSCTAHTHACEPMAIALGRKVEEHISLHLSTKAKPSLVQVSYICAILSWKQFYPF